MPVLVRCTNCQWQTLSFETLQTGTIRAWQLWLSKRFFAHCSLCSVVVETVEHYLETAKLNSRSLGSWGTDRSCFAGFARWRIAHTQVCAHVHALGLGRRYKGGRWLSSRSVVSRQSVSQSSVVSSQSVVWYRTCWSLITYSIIYGHSCYIINKETDNKLLKRSFHPSSSMVFGSGAVTSLWTTIKRAIGHRQDQPPSRDP